MAEDNPIPDALDGVEQETANTEETPFEASSAQLRQLIALNAYAAHSLALAGPPRGVHGEEFTRGRAVQIGDVVVETTTAFRWAREGGDPGIALGELLDIVEEPAHTREEYEAYVAANSSDPDDETPYDELTPTTVYYVRTFDSSGVIRWSNCSFIRVHAAFFTAS